MGCSNIKENIENEMIKLKMERILLGNERRKQLQLLIALHIIRMAINLIFLKIKNKYKKANLLSSSNFIKKRCSVKR